MTALVDRLKHVARRLHRSIERGEQSSDGIVPPGETLQRRHCLHAVALRLGFRAWPHATAVLQRKEQHDWGTLMYRDGAGMTNLWTATYDEARALHTSPTTFLLPYAHQFQIVEPPYIEWLGLDQLQVVLGVLLRHYELTLLDAEAPGTVRKNVTLGPSTDVPVRIAKR